jgi:hypothetical protein
LRRVEPDRLRQVRGSQLGNDVGDSHSASDQYF